MRRREFTAGQRIVRIRDLVGEIPVGTLAVVVDPDPRGGFQLIKVRIGTEERNTDPGNWKAASLDEIVSLPDDILRPGDRVVRIADPHGQVAEGSLGIVTHPVDAHGLLTVNVAGESQRTAARHWRRKQ